MKITIKGFVHKSADSNYYTFFVNDMTQYDYFIVGPHEFEYEIPANFNPTKLQVDSLEKQLDNLSDRYHKAALQIKNKIAELQCLEFSPKVKQ